MPLTEWDWDTALKVRGEESFEEGVERGMERATLKNALSMKEKGIDLGPIAEITGLPVDTILNL
jgi:hypothetical protein